MTLVSLFSKRRAQLASLRSTLALHTITPNSPFHRNLRVGRATMAAPSPDLLIGTSPAAPSRPLLGPRSTRAPPRPPGTRGQPQGHVGRLSHARAPSGSLHGARLAVRAPERRSVRARVWQSRIRSTRPSPSIMIHHTTVRGRPDARVRARPHALLTHAAPASRAPCCVTLTKRVPPCDRPSRMSRRSCRP